jgi:hypothetical protein
MIKNNCLVLAFSKDNALQLDAAIRSFFLHNIDADKCEVRVLYKASNKTFKEQYKTLDNEYSSYRNISIIEENDFKKDLTGLLAPFEHVFFLADNAIFVREFSTDVIIEYLNANPAALGCSFRLGSNTTYSLSKNKIQFPPEFIYQGNNIRKYNWTKAQLDFSYPLETSCSLYSFCFCESFL